MDHELIQFSGILSALFLGIILGLSHSTDGDHVVAVSTMARDYKNIMKSIWVGISWGLGHSTPLLILGILILIIKESLMSFYEKIAVYFEFGVAIMLILLGIQVFWKLRQGIFHTHSHDHDKNKHTHMHASHSHNDNQESEHYENEPHPLLTMFPFFRPKSFIIGLIHGMAGSAAVMLAILPTTPSLFTGLLFLLFFSFGTMMAMAMMTLVLAVPFKYTNSNKFGNYVVAVFGTLSILLGIALASDIGLGTSYTDVLWY
jgi:ABC-type nickel/cobalt efflux system permease component RcnA